MLLPCSFFRLKELFQMKKIRLASNVFPDVGSVGRIEKKKKHHSESRNRRPWYPNILQKMFLF